MRMVIPSTPITFNCLISIVHGYMNIPPGRVRVVRSNPQVNSTGYSLPEGFITGFSRRNGLTAHMSGGEDGAMFWYLRNDDVNPVVKSVEILGGKVVITVDSENPALYWYSYAKEPRWMQLDAEDPDASSTTAPNQLAWNPELLRRAVEISRGE